VIGFKASPPKKISAVVSNPESRSSRRSATPTLPTGEFGRPVVTVVKLFFGRCLRLGGNKLVRLTSTKFTLVSTLNHVDD
jgi:hypothetical protein